MSDAVNGAVPPAAGQAATPSPEAQSGQPPAGAPAEAGPGTPAPQYVTVESLKELVIPLIQSATDKRDTKIKTRMDEFDRSLATLKGAGVNLSPEQAQAARNKAFEAAMSEPPTQAEASPPAGQPDPLALETFNDPVARTLLAETQKLGVRLTSADEESKGINLGDPVAYLDSYRAQLAKKVQRLASSSQANNPAPAGSPAGRIPTTSGSPSRPKMSGMEKIAAGMKNPTGPKE